MYNSVNIIKMHKHLHEDYIIVAEQFNRYLCATYIYIYIICTIYIYNMYNIYIYNMYNTIFEFVRLRPRTVLPPAGTYARCLFVKFDVKIITFVLFIIIIFQTRPVISRVSHKSQLFNFYPLFK